MNFYDFCDLVEPFATTKNSEFKKCVAEQITFLKIKPKQYDDLFNLRDFATSIDWEVDMVNLVRMFRKGQGDLNKALAFYFMYHHKKPFFQAARNVDDFLFEGVHFENQFDLEKYGRLPSHVDNVSKSEMAGRQNRLAARSEYEDGQSPTETLLKIVDRLTGDKVLTDFILRLDWDKKDNAFKFDPDNFHNTEDERLLDQALYNLSLAGGIVRRGEINLRDASMLRSWVKIIMGNREVQAYLDWLHNDDQIPDHVDFLDAIDLFEQLTNLEVPAYKKYRKIAAEVLKEIDPPD